MPLDLVLFGRHKFCDALSLQREAAPCKGRQKSAGILREPSLNQRLQSDFFDDFVVHSSCPESVAVGILVRARPAGKDCGPQHFGNFL